ncbi:hypothetical protein ABEB36_006534 [Hypothenemus hampei]|uniref:Uncharacterized protein n=1 Tax=Hypothenemus hampei TaxID=57062 RepID=A0ABD1EQV0_HYPHA
MRHILEIFIVIFGAVSCEWVEISQIEHPAVKDSELSDTVLESRDNSSFEESSIEYSDQDEELSVVDSVSKSNVLNVLKNFQRQLTDFKGTFSLEAKVERLKELRDDILHEIKFRISRLFKPLPSSESRFYQDLDHDRHDHLDYPSNEGALMTIGFLTFAVFLIKLVLKLIYTLKLKQQYYYYQSTTTPGSIFLKKEDNLEESAKIMRYIQEYNKDS